MPESAYRSCSSLTRADGQEFFAIAPQAGVVTDTTAYPLVQANEHVPDGPVAPQRAPQGVRGAPDQVRLVERHARDVALDGKWTFPRDALDRVVQRDGLEDGPQLVKAVGPHAEDAQIEVDLGVGTNRDAGRRARLRLC